MTVAVKLEAVLDHDDMIDWQPQRLTLVHWRWGTSKTTSPLSIPLTDIARFTPLKQLTPMLQVTPHAANLILTLILVLLAPTSA